MTATTIHDYLYDYGTDNAGNLNTKKDGTTTLMTYSYDALNSTSSIVNGSTTTSFKYNAANQRLSKTTGTITTNSIWDNGQIAFDYVNNNGTYSKQQYLQSYGQDGTVTNGTIMANTLDGKNNVVGSLAPGINMRIYNSQFDAYGNNKLSQNTSTPFGYDGYYTDGETGLCYLNARYYDPSTQQFTQEDTYWGDNLQGNLYGYCSANPVMLSDPSGNFTIRIGKPTEPTQSFDEDFKYNKNVHANFGDYCNLAAFRTANVAANFVYPNASAAYSHYLDGTGTDLQIDYGKVITQDYNVRQYINNMENQILIQVEILRVKSGKNSFSITSDLYAVGKPSTVDVQKTIGVHYVWASANIKYNKKTDMYSMDLTIHMKDRYNFNKDSNDYQTQLSDNINGRFAVLGWAKSFFTVATYKTTINWRTGSRISYKLPSSGR